jgi:hypothetical protein
MQSDAEQLLLAATYLKWWRDGVVADTDVLEDIGQIITTLERLAGQLERGVIDDEEFAPPRGAEPPEDE